MPFRISSTPSPTPAARTDRQFLSLKVSENDPAMKAELVGNGTKVILRGTANNRGTVASFLAVEFDGKRVRVPLSRGDTAKAAKEKLSQAMPAGYQVFTPVEAGRSSADLAQFVIRKVAVAKSNVAEIDAAFRKATKASSESGAKVGVTELRTAVAVAEKGGLSDLDKQTLASNWARLFNGAGYAATPAAQREYARLQQELDLPVFPVR